MTTALRRETFDHVVALDGLRFLAAATVLIGHSTNALAKPEDVQSTIFGTPLVIFFNGYGAVHLFFVLSGFCLAGSAGRVRSSAELAQFYVRRIFRIHPPYMAALALAWLASFLYDTSQAAGLSPYALKRASVHLPIGELLPYFLYPQHAAHQLGPAWTLFVEMNFSFLLPLMLWITRVGHWSLLLVLSLLPFVDGGVLPDFLDYALQFSLGIALYLERERLGRLLSRFSALAQVAVVGVGLFLFVSPHLFGLVFARSGGYAPLGLAVSGFGGAVLVIAAIFASGVRGPLEKPALVYGGRISYSFYLLHYPIMLLALRAVLAPVGPVGGVLYVGSVLAATTLAAALMFAVVERPSIRAGNALCRWLARRTHADTQLSRLPS